MNFESSVYLIIQDWTFVIFLKKKQTNKKTVQVAPWYMLGANYFPKS